MTQYAYPDAVSALHGLFAVLCALDYRTRTGRGQYINLSQFEATVGIAGHVMMEYLANGREPQRLGNGSLHAAPHGCYRCAGDDRWCAIAVDERGRVGTLLRGRSASRRGRRDPRFATRAAAWRTRRSSIGLVEGWTSQRDAYDVMARTAGRRHRRRRGADHRGSVPSRPQLAARQFFEHIEHARKGTVIANGIPLGLTGTPGRTSGAGTAVGADNDYVFGELLGHDGGGGASTAWRSAPSSAAHRDP